MAERARHAFGSEANISEALAAGKIDAYDILFLDEKKVGWIDRNGEVVIAEPDLSGVEADISTLESELANKVNAEEVDTKINTAVTDSVASANAYTDKKIEAAVDEHMVKKYEIADVPSGTLVDYRDKEIRIMCPTDAVFTKQSVGVGGDADSYYMTFKVYAPSVDAVGYIEHLGDKADEEILNTFSKDEYGRRYQPTWLALAKYDEASGEWNYYGKSSTTNKYIGWDYQIDWYNADGVMIASDCVRINLSNEGCHSYTKPYYVGEMEAKIAEASAYEIIEF